MRLKPRVEKALLFLSDPARPGWVVVDAWAVRSGAVVFRTQSGPIPNRPETVSVSHLAAILGLSAADVLRELRACSKPNPETDLLTRLDLARTERTRIQALQQFFRTYSPR